MSKTTVKCGIGRLLQPDTNVFSPSQTIEDVVQDLTSISCELSRFINYFALWFFHQKRDQEASFPLQDKRHFDFALKIMMDDAKVIKYTEQEVVESKEEKKEQDVKNIQKQRIDSRALTLLKQCYEEYKKIRTEHCRDWSSSFHFERSNLSQHLVFVVTDYAKNCINHIWMHLENRLQHHWRFIFHSIESTSCTFPSTWNGYTAKTLAAWNTRRLLFPNTVKRTETRSELETELKEHHSSTWKKIEEEFNKLKALCPLNGTTSKDWPEQAIEKQWFRFLPLWNYLLQTAEQSAQQAAISFSSSSSSLSSLLSSSSSSASSCGQAQTSSKPSRIYSVRTFTLLPQYSFQAKFVQLDMMCLLRMFNTEQRRQKEQEKTEGKETKIERKYLQPNEDAKIWSTYFDLDALRKVAQVKNQSTSNVLPSSIRTDGVSICIHKPFRSPTDKIQRKRKDTNEAKEKNKKQGKKRKRTSKIPEEAEAFQHIDLKTNASQPLIQDGEIWSHRSITMEILFNRLLLIWNGQKTKQNWMYLVLDIALERNIIIG